MQKTIRGVDEAGFLAAYDPTRYDPPSVTVDVVLLTVKGTDVHVLLGQRSNHPAKGAWGLPGGFVRSAESLDDAAARVLAEKAGLRGIFIEQLYTFGAPQRDPRTRVISVAYYALVDAETLATAVGRADPERLVVARLAVSDERSPGTVAVLGEGGDPLRLAFDHADIIGTAMQRIRGKLGYAPIGFELLPEEFTLRDLRLIHEAILQRPINKDSFRRHILDQGLVHATGARATGVGHRPPELYRFATR
ncbi:MAG TPA: NUDIX domain-containing protein [Candidatus Limnocylindria bacterium]|nr:NUDIX domain-containing protein [Candidatus Limnocylindria bacterium]